MQIVTVLKSGGDYTPDHVGRLYGACRRWVRGCFDFVCLTDESKEEIRAIHPNIRPIPLNRYLPGWWSKMEMFREDYSLAPRRLYLDLDTVPVGPFRELWEREEELVVLKDFNKGTVATGLILWSLDLSWILEELPIFFKNHRITEKNWKKHWDQRYVAQQLKKREIKPGVFQDLFPNWIQSYKLHCKKGLPEGTRIVCFHGQPRPWDVDQPWVIQNWRKENVTRLSYRHSRVGANYNQ
jgi:hypothetical protein